MRQQLIEKGVVIADVDSARLLREPLTCADAEAGFLEAHRATVARRTCPCLTA